MRQLLVLFLMCLGFSNLWGQIALNTKDEVSGYTALPQENIFVHTNTSFFLTGEYLFYKVYCLSSKDGGLTKLSKVAYVELVGQDGEPAFRHKVLLKNGLGQGDFFLPTDMSSGSYKLIAYTNWIRNQDQDSFYQGDIMIVNPYRSNQRNLQKSNINLVDSLLSSKADSMPDTAMIATDANNAIGPLQMTINGKHFGKRAKVVMSLKGRAQNQGVKGNYSISVRKKNIITEPSVVTISDLFTQRSSQRHKTSTSIGDYIMPPELRGELLQGKVTALEEGTSVKNLKVAVSIPGEDYVLEIVSTDVFGSFLVNIDKNYSTKKLFLQVLSQKPEAYSIEISEPESLDYTRLDFKDITLDVTMREEILQRSIHNQIENSFFQYRPDSIMTVSSKHFLDSKVKKTYLLDDYKRFKTVRETLLEIIQDVSSKRMGKDDYAIRVKGYDYASVSDIAPLLLLDGCLIQDHNALLAFDARAIEEIDVFRHKFIYGPEIYEGAMVLKTGEGNAYDLIRKDDAMTTFNMTEPQQDKKYFVQRYNNPKDDEFNSRLPDDRLQLLWMPKLKVVQNDFEIDFFTSDVSGDFEIRLEGITNENRPVSIRKLFTVD